MTILAVFSDADATVLAALVGGAATIITAAIGSGFLGRRMKRVEQQVTPNGGASIKDQVTRIEGTVAGMGDRLDVGARRMDDLDARTARMEAGLRALLDAAGIRPPHHTDTDPR